VMEAMLDVVNRKNNPVTPAPAASTPAASVANAISLAGSAGVPRQRAGGVQPSVSLVQGSSILNLVAEATQMHKTKTNRPHSLPCRDQALNESLRLAQESAQQALLKNAWQLSAKLAFGPGGWFCQALWLVASK